MLVNGQNTVLTMLTVRTKSFQNDPELRVLHDGHRCMCGNPSYNQPQIFEIND